MKVYTLVRRGVEDEFVYEDSFTDRAYAKRCQEALEYTYPDKHFILLEKEVR